MRLLQELNAPQEMMDFLLLIMILVMGVIMFVRYKNIGKNRDK